MTKTHQRLHGCQWNPHIMAHMEKVLYQNFINSFRECRLSFMLCDYREWR